MDGETKTYLNGKPSGTSVYVNYSTEASTVWVWNTKYNTFTTNVDGTDFYMGTYNSYATLSCSKISYADTSFPSQWFKEGVMDSNVPSYTDEDKLNCEVLSYTIAAQEEGVLDLITTGKKFNEVSISYAINEDGHGAIALQGNSLIVNNVKNSTKVSLNVTFTLGELTKTRTVEFRVLPLEAPTEILDVVTDFEANTEYYFAIDQQGLGSTLFFTGAMNGFYGATSKDSAEGVKVTATAVEGGYNLSFVDKDGVTQYINAVVSGDHLNFTFAPEATSVWTWNADYNTFITMCGEKEVFMGTYGTYSTVSLSETSKIATNYPIHFYDLTTVTDALMVSETVKELESKLELGVVTEETVIRLVSLYDVEVSVELPEGSEALAWDADYLILTLTPQSAAKTSEDITVTVTKGEVTQTFTVTVITSTAKEITIAEAKSLADGLDAVIVGTVESIDEAWSTQYKNISVTLKDETGTILIYRLKTNVEVGAKIIVTGKVGSYNDNKQIVSATAEIIGGTVTIPQFLALEDGADIVVKGTVKSIDEAWNEKYGNMSVTITDGTNDLYVYRLKTQVAVDDEVTVTGKVGSYNGNKQVTNGTAEIAAKPEAGVLTATTAWAVANSIEVKNSTDIGLDSSLFTTTFAQNDASNPTKFYTSGSAIRMYGKDGNGCQMKVVANGAKILTVKISYVSGYNNATVYAGNLETKLTDTDSADNVAVYEVNNSTFVIKNENSGTTQVRIASIEIVYQLAE